MEVSEEMVKRLLLAGNRAVSALVRDLKGAEPSGLIPEDRVWERDRYVLPWIDAVEAFRVELGDERLHLLLGDDDLLLA